MKQISLRYAKPSAVTVRAKAYSSPLINFPTKKFCQHTCLLWVAVVLFSSCAFGQKGTIKGTVTSSEDILQGATVTAGNLAVLTDDNGRFSISLEPGNHTLIITHVGYQKMEQPIKVEAGNTQSFDFRLTPADQLGEVVVLGSRSNVQRSSLNSPVPVDVFSPKQLLQSGQVNLTQMLNFTAPSLNASRELLNEPVTLRGLDPQHVLILLNGTRYHNLVWYYGGNLKGQLGRGSVGNDLTSIPFSAIEKVEVLRDGAAAQYGSDAIAGVINIRLKETTGKTSIHLHTGQYYEGDGEKLSFGINRGFHINQKGFVNFSVDYRYQLPAYRGGVYQGTVYKQYPAGATHNDSIRVKADDDSIIKARGFDRSTILDNAGTLKSVRFGMLMNGGYSFKGHTEIFWTAAVNDRTAWRDANYRFPKVQSQVNLALFPNGVQPKSKPNTVDVSTIVGIKGETTKNIRWEITSGYGSNGLRSYSSNNNNPSQSSLGKEAPTSFYLGKQIYHQLTNNINLAKTYTSPSVRSLNIAVGAEWRIENYRTQAGDSAAWYNYDLTGSKQGGVGGIEPRYALNKTRNVFGAYLDIETEINNRLLLDAASRYEYYNDFGSNVAGKLAGRYKLSDRFMLRASINNGFRAPSLQQRYDISITTAIDRATGQPIFSGLFPNEHEVARALGIPSLAAERTLNASSGLTAKLNKRLSLTVDAYWIQIKNRVILSGDSYGRSNPIIDSILRPYTSLSQITDVAFFSNAINTRTYGIDVVLNGSCNFKKASLRYTLSANVNRTHVYGTIQTPRNIPPTDANINVLLNRANKATIERGQPQDKMLLNVTYQKGKMEFVLNNTRFGKTVSFHQTTTALDEYYTPRILSDLSINYKMKGWLTITVGSNNIFNVYPDKIKHYENSAQGIFIYNPEATPFGFYGGYYFTGIRFNW
jgi:iron complex outermembrane recepter protein